MIPKLLFAGRASEHANLIRAAAFSQVSQAEADRTMEVCSKYGVTTLITAASYGDAELRLDLESRHRNDFFLASKLAIAL